MRLILVGPLTALLTLAAGLPAAAPALADSFLCVGADYSTCLTAGYTDHGYHLHNSTSYWNAFPGHNCTNYVAYAQTTLGVAKPSFWLGDAWQWWSEAAGHVTEDHTATVGAVAYWGKNQAGSGSGGHVANVETVAANGSITISEDAYPKGPFAWRTISAGSPNWPAGFIHFTAAANPPAPNPPAPTPNVAWNFQNLDGTAGSPGGHVSRLGLYPVAVTYQGNLHLFYYDSLYGYLRHAWYDGGTWRFEVIDGAGGSGGRTLDNTGLAPSAVVAGQALDVFYYDSTSHALRRAWLDSGGWHLQTVDKAGNPGTASAATYFRSSLQVFYPDLVSGNLRHAWARASGKWQFENLDGSAGSVAGKLGNGSQSAGDSLAATVFNGAIRLLYHSASTQTLRYAWSDGSAWHFANLDGGHVLTVSGDTDSIGRNPSVTAAAGSLHVFSYDSTLGDLRHEWYDGTAWHFENLDGATAAVGPDHFDVGLYSAPVLSGATLRVFYYDSTWGELRQAASAPGQSWQFTNLDGLGGQPATRVGANSDVGSYVFAAIYRGVPHVFYYDATQGNLRHAWAQ